MLTPDTSVEMLFNDTEGLVDTLKERPNCLVKYNPQSRASQASSRMVIIGSKLPFSEIKSILVETLTRYDKLHYYSVSNDHFLRSFYHEFEIGIGFGNKGAKELGITAIKSVEMLEALETSQTTKELLKFIRSRYQSEFKTFEIQPITVTSYQSATVGAVNPPAASRGKIHGSEYLATTNGPDFYGLTSRMYVDTLDEFLEQLPEVEPMFNEWVRNRGDEARDFAVCVGAEGSLQNTISDYITDAYNKGAVFGNAPEDVTISVIIDNRANDSKLYYKLNRKQERTGVRFWPEGDGRLIRAMISASDPLRPLGKTLSTLDEVQRLINQTRKLSRTRILVIGLVTLVTLAIVMHMLLARKDMHDALTERIMSDDEIRQLVGVVEFIDYDSSGSAAAFGGLRSEKMWILKVNGDKGCIYIHAVLDDTFPDYRVISVEPEKSQQSRVQHCSQI